MSTRHTDVVGGDLGPWLVEEGKFGPMLTELTGQAALVTSEEGEEGSALPL